MPFFMLINVKMSTIVGILTFMSRKNFMLNSVEHEKSFVTSGPELRELNTYKLTNQKHSPMKKSKKDLGSDEHHRNMRNTAK